MMRPTILWDRKTENKIVLRLLWGVDTHTGPDKAQAPLNFFSVPKPDPEEKKRVCFSHTALDRRQESPHKARVMTKLGGCMLH